MGTRTYLRPQERRRQLLDAASRLFDRGGFTAITVSAVAAEAGSSRRLVYDHFTDLGELYASFFEDRVIRYATAIDAASAPDVPGEPRSLAGAFGQLLALPAQDLRAIRLLIADRSTPELAPARTALRTHLQSRWLPTLAALGYPAEVADAVLWTLAASFVTLADLVSHGELEPSAAGVLSQTLVSSLPDAAARLIPAPSPTSEIS